MCPKVAYLVLHGVVPYEDKTSADPVGFILAIRGKYACRSNRREWGVYKLGVDYIVAFVGTPYANAIDWPDLTSLPWKIIEELVFNPEETCSNF